MIDHVELWAEFLGAAVLVVLAGVRLVHYGDVLAEKLGLGKALIGMLLIGWVTSLPEMVLSIGAIVSIGSPDMAVGNITGSLALNQGILAIFAVVQCRSVPIRRSPHTLTLSAVYSLVLTIVALAAMVAAYAGAPLGSFLAVSPASWAILGLYAYSTWALFRQDRTVPEESSGVIHHGHVGLVATLLKALVAAGAIVAAGVFLAHTGDAMAEQYGLTRSVVGIYFLAIVSSLPELAATIAALRRGFFDMAAGNIFGSNIFNVAIVAVCDLLYREGSIFEGLTRREMPQQFAAGAIAVLLTAVALTGLVARRRAGEAAGADTARARPEMIVNAILYVVGMTLLACVFGGA